MSERGWRDRSGSRSRSRTRCGTSSGWTSTTNRQHGLQQTITDFIIDAPDVCSSSLHRWRDGPELANLLQKAMPVQS